MINQCSDCGGFCKKSGCERENVKPTPKRKPLSVEKILHLVETHVGAPSMSYPLDNSDWINFARAIETAHNIKEKNT